MATFIPYISVLLSDFSLLNLPEQDNVLITDDGNVAVTDIAVYTEACRWLLFPSDRNVKIQRSFIYQAPEFLNPGTESFNPPTKPMDVFAFGSLILAVRLFSYNMHSYMS